MANFNPNQFANNTKNYLNRITPFGFSGVILIAYQGNVLLREGYGLADRENHVLNTPETVFSLGSVTKQFTAAAIMQLVVMGKLSPSDLLSKYLEGIPEDKASITLHHLLTHTSGSINYTGDDYEPLDREGMLEKVLNAPLAFQPGEFYAYSNAGYSVLAALVEIVSGEPYETFLYNHLLKPAGLEKTGYLRPDWSGSVAARWYTGEKDHGHALEKHYPSWNVMGNGEMLSSLDEMLLWDHALLGDSVLSAEVKSQMFNPYLGEYGYGWRIGDSLLGKVIEHNGASDLGASALFRRYVEAGLTIIMFCNQSYGDTPMVLPLEGKLEQLLVGEEIPLPPEVQPPFNVDFEALLGRYTLGSNGSLHVVDQGGILGVRAESQEAINLLVFPGESIDSYAQLNQRTLEVFRALLQGDNQPLSLFLNDPDRRLAPVSEMVARNMAASAEFYGDFVGVEVLGTVPSSFRNDALDTMIAVRFERGTGGLVSITQAGVNVGVAVVDVAQGWVMAAVQLGDELVCYHIPMALTVRLGIQKDARGVIAGLIGDSQAGSLVAKRMETPHK